MSDWNGYKGWGAARGLLSKKSRRDFARSMSSKSMPRWIHQNLVIYSSIKTQTQRGLPFHLRLKLLIMQSVMFNSRHISVSKDTLHSHVILRRPLEAKIASLLSQKDKKKWDNTPAHIQGSGASSWSSYLMLQTQKHTPSTEHDQYGCERN